MGKISDRIVSLHDDINLAYKLKDKLNSAQRFHRQMKAYSYLMIKTLSPLTSPLPATYGTTNKFVCKQHSLGKVTITAGWNNRTTVYNAFIKTWFTLRKIGVSRELALDGYDLGGKWEALRNILTNKFKINECLRDEIREDFRILSNCIVTLEPNPKVYSKELENVGIIHKIVLPRDGRSLSFQLIGEPQNMRITSSSSDNIELTTTKGKHNFGFHSMYNPEVIDTLYPQYLELLEDSLKEVNRITIKNHGIILAMEKIISKHCDVTYLRRQTRYVYVHPDSK